MNAKPEEEEEEESDGGAGASVAAAAAAVEVLTIDEEKINQTLAMLQNADPTGEIEKDPADLVTFEEQCHKVTFLRSILFLTNLCYLLTRVPSSPTQFIESYCLNIGVLVFTDGTFDRYRARENRSQTHDHYGIEPEISRCPANVPQPHENATHGRRLVCWTVCTVHFCFCYRFFLLLSCGFHASIFNPVSQVHLTWHPRLIKCLHREVCLEGFHLQWRLPVWADTALHRLLTGPIHPGA